MVGLIVRVTVPVAVGVPYIVKGANMTPLVSVAPLAQMLAEVELYDAYGWSFTETA